MKNYFFRCTAIFILILSLGVGTAWADEITVYVTGEIFIGTGENAWDNSTSTIKVDARYKGSEDNFNSSDAYMDATMTKTDYTYNGYPIYSYTFTPTNGGGQYRFKHYKSGVWKEDYTAAWSTENGKIYDGYYSSSHHWLTYGRDITIYAVPESMDGSKWDEGYTLKSIFKYGDGDSEKTDKLTWTNTGYTYNGNYIYTCTALMPYNVIKNIKFYYNDGSDKELYDCGPNYGATQYGTNDIDGKVLLGWNGSSHDWEAYGRDVTVYTIPDYLFKDKGTPYDEDTHYAAVCIQMGTGSTWNTVNMTKTSYTYATYPIYKATILIDKNKFWEYQIKYFKKSDDTQVDLYQFNQSEPKAEYAPSYIDDKLYHGYNGSSHDFFSYRYDVALDMQSGGGGSTSIIAIDGSAMPSATMPGRNGYAFGGYWTETNGGGTQYYNSDGSSTRNWDSRTITTLYAKWTARNYTINLEGMEADSEEPIQVNVTYDGNLSQVTPHTKTNYTFDGYWVRNESTLALETQLIDANGNWIKDVAGYTSNDGEGHPTWVHDYAISLYAKWNETPRTITLNVSPAGAGTVSPVGPVTAYIVTPSATITATPNPGWVFKKWQYGTNVGPYTGTGTDNTVQVTASVNGTLTAVFEPRYYLVGGEITGTGDGGSGTESGMPGWGNYNKPFNLVTNSPILATCSLTLGTNKNFYIMVRDKADGLSYGKSGGISLGDDASVKFENQDNKVLFYSNGGTNYTFKITAVDVNGRPTVSVERPHQMHFAHKRVDIDGNDHNDDLGGTLTATINGESAAHEQWFDYGSDVGWTATAETGYSLTWYTDNAYSNAMNPQPSASWSDPDITHDENIYAKFTEIPTSVTLANDGNGKVQIGGADATSTTCGVTTTRELTAVPNEGYMFSSWTKTSGDDITLSSTSTNPTTLSGNGSGATSGQTVTANFVERYSIKGTMNGENWSTTHTLSNIGTNASSKDTCYVTMTLPANTTYEFAIYDEHTKGWLKNSTTEVFKMTYTNHTNWGFGTNKTVNCGITTAGKGTYKFIFNITDTTVTVVYPTSYQVNYGASVGGSVTSVVDGDENAVPNGGYVVAGGSVTYTAAAASGYTFVGWCNSDSYGNTFTNYNPWTNSSIAATSNAYAKFKSTNFVIYRTGDMAEDDRAALDDVESYDGGTISETIEFRMKVRELDKWYTLCLPFTVSAVKVWEEADCAYYDLVPFYRPTVGGTFYTGDYIIRTPKTATDLSIEEFGDWRDPTSPTGYLPSKNTPYIIQWHDSYFAEEGGRYISFFGATGQTITTFSAGDAPSSDNVVNVYGNNSMQSGSVAGVYLLENDYGSNGAWLRLEDASTARTILPFECYIRANTPTTTKYRVLRRDMTIDDTPTGWEDVLNSERKAQITVYTISGFRVAQFDDCSYTEAATRLRTEHGEGIYILRADNESVKLMVGGK